MNDTYHHLYIKTKKAVNPVALNLSETVIVKEGKRLGPDYFLIHATSSEKNPAILLEKSASEISNTFPVLVINFFGDKYLSGHFFHEGKSLCYFGYSSDTRSPGINEHDPLFYEVFNINQTELLEITNKSFQNIDEFMNAFLKIINVYETSDEKVELVLTKEQLEKVLKERSFTITASQVDKLYEILTCGNTDWTLSNMDVPLYRFTKNKDYLYLTSSINGVIWFLHFAQEKVDLIRFDHEKAELDKAGKTDIEDLGL